MTAFKNYLIGILLILSLTFGGLTYHLVGKLSIIESQVETVEKNNKKVKEDIEKLQLSCKSTQEVAHEVGKITDSMQEGMTSDLERLSQLIPKTTPKVKQDVSKEITEPQGHADGGTISNELNELLNSAYCNAVRNDSACAPK
ncbi:hypothetical protein [Pseudomonas phage vB_PseuGesM_254]|uniref:DUF948 domain-containing protein n=1 Tax=Pseudomonas phage vB_PseuGesM_254 TaxID=3092638 RepID=A0AAX4G6I9_9CAUD|nr:hypothetical protein [Pseudomonas phage PseuGes_254]